MHALLTQIILEYESDTFNAKMLRVTKAEARTIARKLFLDLCRIVEEGGRMTCDGVRLTEELENIR